LQSEGELTIASTGKDPATGRLVTQEYRVTGPVMIFLTTTAIEVDEEFLNRCLVLTVDEGREQTRAIHERQRAAQTLEGMLAKAEQAHVVKVHRDAQRLLRPMLVVNPYARELTFLDHATRTRRDHMKYLTLIRTIALLHQHQRRVLTVEHRGRRLQYLEVRREDIAVANRLCHEVLGRSLDELPPQTRRLLGLVTELVAEACRTAGLERRDFRFSRREVIHLTVWDLDQERGTLMVRQGKGKKDRMVPIGERAVAWLGRYLDEARPKLVMPPDAGVLFLTQEGEELSPNRLTQLVREHVSAAELDKSGACHLFRHTCATLMLEGGADIRYIQELLGHVELSTTQIYTRVSIRKLKAVHTLTHPGARLGQRSAEGFPCLAAEPALNVAVTDQGDELDAEAALEGAAGDAQRPADAAGELMATLDAEADEDPEEGA